MFNCTPHIEKKKRKQNRKNTDDFDIVIAS